MEGTIPVVLAGVTEPRETREAALGAQGLLLSLLWDTPAGAAQGCAGLEPSLEGSGLSGGTGREDNVTFPPDQ